MGKTAMKGPVYGAKSLLWSYFVATGSSNGGTTNTAGVNSARTIPPYEDWFVTEAAISVSTHSSVAGNIAMYLKTEGGSSALIPRDNGSGTTNAGTILTFNQTATSTSWSTWATATVSAGEYEGFWCPAGSTLRLVSSGTSAPGGINLQVMGYIRFVSSTRSEG